MRVRILASALRDIADSRSFYMERGEEDAAFFMKYIYQDINYLKVTAGSHPRRPSGFYKAVCKKIPHLIFYRLLPNEIRVAAVIDGRRDPEFNRKRLGGI